MKQKIAHPTEKGQSLTELAIMLVFLLILLAGVVDLGRMLFEYQAIRDAAQEGAGYGSIFPSYCGEIKNRVIQNFPSLLPDNIEISIDGGVDNCFSASTDIACEDHEIVVSIDHNYIMSMPYFAGTNVPMHVEIKDRIVRPSCSS